MTEKLQEEQQKRDIMNEEKIRKLSKREIEVIMLKARGFVDKQIAKELGISYGTVRNHIDKSKLKLRCLNTAQLALVLKDAGLINGDYINA